jgi:chitin disaccharide deacetylase
MPNKRTNELLGYPTNARLLIVNADDFGMYHAVNEAIFRTLREGVVCSTSLMVPCPWALHAMHLLRENPDIPFGIHLTMIRDLSNYAWGPLTPRKDVPSLIDETGYFYNLEHMSDVLARAKLDEVELEFRAQIESVLTAGLNPTHLDWHCLHNAGRVDFLDMTVELAKEYGLALRVYDPSMIEKLQSQGLPTDDHDLLDSYDLDTVDKSARYVRMLRELPMGLSEWAVHPGLGNSEAQAIDPGGWKVRQTDFEFLMSSEARETIRQEEIILLSYRSLQELWQSK